MSPFRCMVRKTVLGLIVVIVLSFVLSGQNNRQLYLVTGYTTRNGPQKVSSNLYRVDPLNHALEHVLELVDAKEGSLSTNTDHERRLVAIVSGSNQAVVLSMDAPSVTHRVPISFDGFLGLTSFIDLPRTGVVLALETTLTTGRQSLTGIGLSPSDPDPRPHDLGWENYQYVRSEGWWSPGEEKRYGGAIELWIRNGKAISKQILSFSDRRIVEVELAVPIPKEAASQTDDRTWGILVNNDEVLILTRLFEQSLGPPAAKGKTRLYVYDKKSMVWHTEDFEGGACSFRGFGNWVVVNQADSNILVINGTAQPNPDAKESPGRLLRQKVLDPEDRPQDQATVEGLFAADYFPGIIYFYDVRSGRRYRMDTRQGDSEVLLVDGNTIYYRVNDTLYRAEISQSAIQDSVEIVRNEDVQLAHWAFLANP